ncbi:MAG: D-arabinose 5-phosphate isomerase [Flavobacterium sp. BFFFF2]|nr:MAG: D-arabinose 5-phosphate isomerase [Flavobacterium sp. BFFFF2]
MNTTINIINSFKNTFTTEIQNLELIAQKLDATAEQAIAILFQTKGRVIVTGIGKSALIAQKMVATFNSTGTPSQFLHAAEAMHGDLGLIQPEDVVICLSKSGNSPEIKALVPLLQERSAGLIAITADVHSFLAKAARVVLHTPITQEACPLNLAPTSSTTAQLVMGDALAVCLMQLRNFKADDFSRYHPGGALGKKLLLRVHDLIDQSKKPTVHLATPIKDVIFEISEKRLGVAAVVEQNHIIGIITDGDIRRMLNTVESIQGLKAADMMSKNPKTISSSMLVQEALDIMEDFSITQLLVQEHETYIGVLHLHDILKEGIV